MPTKLSRTLAISLLALSLSGSVALAAQPTLPPPGGNVPAPINIGAAPQSKAGTFGSLLGGFWDLLGLNSVLFTGETSVNPVPGACPAGYSWVEEGNPNGTIDNGECNIISFFAGTNGNVGIGTTNPAGKLHTYSAEDGSYNIFETANYGGIKLINGGESSFIGSRAGKMYFYAGDGVTEDMTILNNGNVGIGKTDPTQKLWVEGSGGTGGLRIAINDTDTNGVQWNLVSGGSSIGGAGKFHIRDGTTGNNRLTIDTNGNVGIGTTDTTGTSKLKVAGIIESTSGGIKFPDGTTQATASGATDLSNLNATNLTSGTVPGARISGSYTGITGVGTINTGTWNGTALSDSYISSAATWNAKAPTASPTFTGTVSGITKAMVGLANVDNTSDVNKPVSSAQQTALNLKANLASPVFTGMVSGVTKLAVGLSDVDNTSDANKPVSSAQQTALNLKANLASPTFTGTVTLDKLTVSGGPKYTSPSLTLLDQNRILFVHNLGYIPWCNWTSSNHQQVVSIRRLTSTEVELRGWSPSMGQSTDIVLMCW